ncbi:hypothetical protein J0S82_013572 [Galemys pyrenaicus]|uniref:DIS3L2 C-terminal domain-containing protein n=1 Tax=Galemys pyrenaicus TaxID=202257 RepID=A0A8J6AAU3_GALPY|nr:hypothetical protein J0S82_013572 [Galemys pyrenaicus]
MVLGVLNQAFDVLVLRYGVQKRVYCNVSAGASPPQGPCAAPSRPQTRAASTRGPAWAPAWQRGRQPDHCSLAELRPCVCSPRLSRRAPHHLVARPGAGPTPTHRQCRMDRLEGLFWECGAGKGERMVDGPLGTQPPSRGGVQSSLGALRGCPLKLLPGHWARLL